MKSLKANHFRILTIFWAFLGLCFEKGFCIDCFKCVSINGDNKACDDPFHNNYSTAILESPCMGGRKGRAGLFPATACIKIAGYYDDNGETITVRGCALDSGTLTTDTEIIRMSHCGKFYYEDKYVHGCLQSCSDADACNSTTSKHQPLTISWNIMMFSLVLYSLYGQKHFHLLRLPSQRQRLGHPHLHPHQSQALTPQQPQHQHHHPHRQRQQQRLRLRHYSYIDSDQYNQFKYNR